MTITKSIGFILAVLFFRFPKGDAGVQTPVQCKNVHEVGGVGFVWEIVPYNSTYYSKWALSIGFETGDCLRLFYAACPPQLRYLYKRFESKEFNRATSGFISVLSPDSYSTCYLDTSPSATLYGAAGRPFVLQLTTEGTNAVDTYYITEDDFRSCDFGMKFAVIVGPSTSPPVNTGMPRKSSTTLSPGAIAGIVIAALTFLFGGTYLVSHSCNGNTCCFCT